MPSVRSFSLKCFIVLLVTDLAKHFQDGRLSAAKLAQWGDEDMEENLISVRGIGKVCVPRLEGGDIIS
jgi:hypothetical protein